MGKPNTLFAYIIACPTNHCADRHIFIVHLIPAYVTTLTAAMEND